MPSASFGDTIDVFVKSLGIESAMLVQREAKRVLDEVVGKTHPAPTYRIQIGSAFVSDIMMPKPGQPIILTFDHRREVAQKMLARLKNRPPSPQEKGDYIASFELHVDGRQADIMDIKIGRAVEILNTADYARRLEVGKKADGSSFVKQVPAGIMERSAKDWGQLQFRRIAKLSFTYRDISNPYILKGSFVGSKYVTNLGNLRKRSGARDRRKGEAVRYPAIIIAEPLYDLRRR